MAEAFTGEIRAFGFNFVPRGWAQCAGQSMSIAEHSALYSLLGTIYGGDGRTTFNLPDLRGRVPVNEGQGPGLSPHRLGEAGGRETVTLSEAQMPSHTHTPNASDFTVTIPASTSDNTTDTPGPTLRLGKTVGATRLDPGTKIYTDAAADTNLGQFPATGNLTIDPTGSSQAHENRMPYLALNYCICLDGIYPPRD